MLQDSKVKEINMVIREGHKEKASTESQMKRRLKTAKIWGRIYLTRLRHWQTQEGACRWKVDRIEKMKYLRWHRMSGGQEDRSSKSLILDLRFLIWKMGCRNNADLTRQSEKFKKLTYEKHFSIVDAHSICSTSCNSYYYLLCWQSSRWLPGSRWCCK